MRMGSFFFDKMDRLFLSKLVMEQNVLCSFSIYCECHKDMEHLKFPCIFLSYNWCHTTVLGAVFIRIVVGDNRGS